MKPETTEIFNYLRSILETHTGEDVTITPETMIRAELVIDSVEMFDIIMEIEDKYDISFPIEETSDIDTVRSLVEAIARLTPA